MITEPLTVHIQPMRRRHIRSVLRIEEAVYPRPWSHSLFLSELALRTTRAYFVARVGRDVVGYAGLMMSADDGHITTIAVDPRWHRHRIATRLMLVLAREALARRARNLTLEVRLSNLGAQQLYRRFGFAPVGVRKNYYQLNAGQLHPSPSTTRAVSKRVGGPARADRRDRDRRAKAATRDDAIDPDEPINEDALVMWVHEVDTDDYAQLLASIESSIPGETLLEERGP